MEWELYQADFEEQAAKKINWVHDELNKIRIGRVSSKILEEIEVDAYGTESSKLMELANILIHDAKTLIVKPYDKSTIKAIFSAINKANIGGNSQMDADLIRISFPSPTEELRKSATVKVKKIIEQGKVLIRDIRHSVLNAIKKDEELNEDNLRWYKEQLDQITKKINHDLEEIQNKKIDDVMRI